MHSIMVHQNHACLHSNAFHDHTQGRGLLKPWRRLLSSTAYVVKFAVLSQTMRKALSVILEVSDTSVVTDGGVVDPSLWDDG